MQPVVGESSDKNIPGVSGTTTYQYFGAPGIRGESTGGHGVVGVGHGDLGHGVEGVSDKSFGVEGTGLGIRAGVSGINTGPDHPGSIGVRGDSNHGVGVMGVTSSATRAAILGFGKLAGRFEGDVEVTGDIRLDGSDYAEELTVGDSAVAAGMVVVLDEDGLLRPCLDEYDHRVAGIIAGANGVRSALVLDRHEGGAAVALMGKVWVLADADPDPIRCGDLLTSSSTPGHARRAADRQRAFGALIGKALTRLESGQGMVRVLVNVA
jgi:hypothetical protein